MGIKLRNLTLSVLLAGSAALLVASPAQARRLPPPTTTTTTEPSYVPPPKYGENPHPEVDVPDPYGDTPVVAPAVVPVDLPAVTDPNAGDAGDGRQLAPVPSVGSGPGDSVLGQTATRPEGASPSKNPQTGGVLSRTGSETMPLVRAGLAALALGAGLLVLARRRRSDAASA